MSHNKTSFPFYVYPMSHKRSTQIIKETKAEIKKMESHRPSTPFGQKKSEKEYNMPVSSRPTSSSSLKSLKYELEEDSYLSVRKLTPFCGVKRKDVYSSNLKLEPLVTKSVLTPRKNTNSLMKSQHHQDVTFPPISCEEKTKDKVKNAENLIKHEVLLHTPDAILADCLSNISCVDSGVVSEENFKTDYTSSLDPEQVETLNIEDENFYELCQELKIILYVLDKNVKLGSRKCEQDIISAICKLYNLLKDSNAFQIMHSYRIPLLKTLFKLLDPNSPMLCLSLIQLLLQMKVKDKNLGTIFRLISRLITYKHINLEQYQIIEPLIEAVQEMSFQNKETILYGINALKSLLFRDMIEHQHLENCATILLRHLSQFNDIIPSAEERCDDTYIDINKQIFITLHYLADNEDVWKILSNPSNLCEILKALSYFYQNSDVIQITVRLISKIIDKEDGCQAFAACPENLLMVLSRILQTHKYNIDITLQTTFIIGNLVLVDKQLAETFLNQFNLHDILTDILEEYAKEHIQTKITLSEKFITSQSDASDNHDWRQNMFEVMSRVLCILANICLSPEAGSFLAHQKDTIMHLLNIISAYVKQDVLKDTSLPVYSFLVVIGNISYYLPTHSDNSLKIAKRVIPLLDDKFSLDVRRESATIVQNLTRFPEVRKYIEDYSLLPAFVKLLSEDDKEFNNAAYGIILNLLLDKNNHSIFYKEQGIARILHKLHLCTERDWKTSSMLCQILWNYCKCLKEDVVPISKIEALHLIKYLSYSIRYAYTKTVQFPNLCLTTCQNASSLNEAIDVENSNSYFTWKNEFCPVAKKLLTLLQSKISSTT